MLKYEISLVYRYSINFSLLNSYMKTVFVHVYYIFGCFIYFFNIIGHQEKKFTIIISTVIGCATMKCGGCENRTKTKPTKSIQI